MGIVKSENALVEGVLVCPQIEEELTKGRKSREYFAVKGYFFFDDQSTTCWFCEDCVQKYNLPLDRIISFEESDEFWDAIETLTPCPGNTFDSFMEGQGGLSDLEEVQRGLE